MKQLIPPVHSPFFDSPSLSVNEGFVLQLFVNDNNKTVNIDITEKYHVSKTLSCLVNKYES